ncbi:hypothetical protein PSU4_37130 [Pseudonocardia sulfidoxydans NBRC 16205]|uniref:Integral membrane protein n=2 Tax=Pseudonocardia sulfidoxydans TaxID=54011 RepID=A0A511DIX1_9PSEU|nr:hypothetical protein [Pseudonocardia sulfidoxydans]GEL24759.1 hypothetical protein PSU4_37130 [Pseudonocardia sulfidoxydans NBRC 16205]
MEATHPATSSAADGGHVELRVHGVAGTPPAVMLQLVPPVRVDRPDDTGPDADGAISEWRRPPERPGLRAWSWGSLTSGRWYQAFYVVLLPFMLANVAGWALLAGPDSPAAAGVPARRGARVRAGVLLVRLAGVLVTVVFVLWAQLIVADLAAYQWLVRRLGTPVWTVGAGLLGATGVLLVVVWLSRIRQRPTTRHVDPWSVWTDPAGRVSLHHDQRPMWDSPGINVALRRLHLGAALGVVGLIGSWPGAGRSGVWDVLSRTGFWAATAGLVVVAVLLCAVSLADGAPGHVGGGRGRGLPPAVLVRHGSWPLPTVAVALAAVSSAGITPEWVAATPFLPAIRGSALWLTAGLLLVVAAVAVAGGPGRRRDGRARHADLRRANAPAILLGAAATGAALGAGLAEQVARLAGGGRAGGLVVGEAVGWMAVAFTTILAATGLVVAFAWLALRFVAVGGRRTLPAPVALRALTIRASWLTALLTVLGVAVAGTGVGAALARGELPPVTSIPPVVSTGVVVALAVPALAGVVAAARHRRFGPAGWAGLALVVAGVSALVVVALREGWSAQLLGVPVPPRSFADLSLALAVVLPTLVLLWRMYAAARSVAVRRGIGVLWDVGTFWPRWFHPLAPPTYSDRAVTGLAQRVAAAAGPGEPLVVAAHSQGSVIAGTALLLAPAPLGPVALFTFGSPWHHLYGEFFPAYFDAAATTALDRRLGGRWRNLWRDTDPVGGPVDDLIDEPGAQSGADPGVDPGVDLAPLADPHDRVHGDYWLEPQYDAAVARLVRSVRRDERARVTLQDDPREQNVRSTR